MKRDGLSLSDLCAALRRGPHTIRHFQQSLGLPVLSGRKGYSRDYRALLERVSFLRIFGVPLDDIAGLFTIEKKLLQLLRVDTSADGPFWYLKWAAVEDPSPNRLLLTHFDVGPWIRDDGTVQLSLDFGTRSPELFKSAEMGEDIRHVHSLYRDQLAAIARRLRDERNVVRDALDWVGGDALRKS